jgi:hypothetical protein
VLCISSSEKRSRHRVAAAVDGRFEPGSLSRRVRTYKISGFLQLDIRRGQKEIDIPAPARPPMVVVVSTRNERRLRILVAITFLTCSVYTGTISDTAVESLEEKSFCA